MPESDARSLEEGAGKRCSVCGIRVPPFCLRGTGVCIPGTKSNSPGIRVSLFRLRVRVSASPVLNPAVLLGLVSLLLRLKGQRNGFSLVFTARLDSGAGGIGLLRLRLCKCVCVCVCMRAYVCVSACVRVYVRACVRMCV